MLRNKLTKYFAWILFVFLFTQCDEPGITEPVKVYDPSQLQEVEFAYTTVPFYHTGFMSPYVGASGLKMSFDDGAMVAMPTGWSKKDQELSIFFHMKGASTTRLTPLTMKLVFDSPLTQDISYVCSVDGVDEPFKIDAKSGESSALSPIVYVAGNGYYCLRVKGEKDSTTGYPAMSIIEVGSDVNGSVEITYMNPKSGSKNKLWRAAPSAHLNYKTSEDNIMWFYNEMTIPSGTDPIHTYYMANGFSEGYFGIQHNEMNEWTILFSVWSSFTTDDPTMIPSEYEVKMVKKGSLTTVSSFGGEGSGKKSYIKKKWKQDQTYKFLVKAEPLNDGKNSVVFTGWIYMPEENKWFLLASFEKPHSKESSLKGLYSFVEDFGHAHSQNSNHYRKALLGNTWVCKSDGSWKPIVKTTVGSTFNADSQPRQDIQGGIEGAGWYLKTGGFFADKVTDSKLEFDRPSSAPKTAPSIDFDALP
ncbi:DUF3472 domain-containing protein [Halosquirtibacter laminarini]|uniref:DUF3472 domain-containing protein n=1 Tax=Halosquirtibacter laminarini TaxID=3374600 RepID=A0AC61NGZ2_9BACT|nr:DUF3472 domain-containing protein [Prolixibacteraceae bacterium]